MGYLEFWMYHAGYIYVFDTILHININIETNNKNIEIDIKYL